MTSAMWASRLMSLERQTGCVMLSALDAAARHLVVIQCLEYEGALDLSVLETGLSRAIAEYPVVLGWIDNHAAAADGSVYLCWDTHDQVHAGFDLTLHTQGTDNVPSIFSTWELWKAGALPNLQGRLAAAKVISYPNANRSILVFAFDHALFDYGSAYRFLQLWLQEAVAASQESCSREVAAEIVLKDHGPAAAKALDNTHVANMKQSTAPAPTCNPILCSAAAAARKLPGPAIHALPLQQSGRFSRGCLMQQLWWTVPQPKQACLLWLQQHQGVHCPFTWDPLDPADSCLQAIKGIIHGSDSEMSVWRIPRSVLQTLKAAAAAVCPLPSGMWYSTSSAAAALLVCTLYAAAPEKARQQGGLHATTVADLRGGRCGLDIPMDSAINASVSGIRVWVPCKLLEAAEACLDDVNAVIRNAEEFDPETSRLAGLCQLVYHVRMGLHTQLHDPHGSINKQFEWFEAARRAGLTHRVALCQGLQQIETGDIVLDWLSPAAELPVLPDTQLVCSSVRMLSSYMDRFVMAMPVPSADGEAGFDMQFEVSFPRSRTSKLYATWMRLGMEQVTVPAQQGRYWPALDGLVYPSSIFLMLKDVLGCLPWLLLRAAKWLINQVLPGNHTESSAEKQIISMTLTHRALAA